MSLMVSGCESNGISSHQLLHDDQIRILVLKAGHAGSPLEASLRTVSLAELSEHGDKFSDGNDPSDKQPETAHFEAISYCWGEPIFSRSCSLHDGATIPLTESLHSALQAFRYPDRSRKLWADAVCINQADIAERSSQVELMGDIFAAAIRVLVWLGDPLESGSDTLAFATLNMPIVPQGDRSKKDLLALMEQHLPSMQRCACCGETSPGDTPVTLAKGLSAVAKLLERPFFSRLWVVQEIVFGRSVEVYCGTHHAPWDIFTELCRVPGQHQGDHEYDDHRYSTAISRAELRRVWAQCNYLNQLRARLYQRKTDTFRPTTLCKDLLMMSNLQCRNPHDRIFGVSRVLGLRDVSSLRADYTLSVAEVYRRVAEVFVTAQANRPGGHGALLLALASTETSEAKLLERPSWVPDLQHLSERSRAKNTYYQWAFAERQYYADAAIFDCFVSTKSPQELCVKGRCFAKVTNILEASQCPSKHTHRRSGEKCSDEEGVGLIRWRARCREFLEQSKYIDFASTYSATEKLDELFSCDQVKDSASLHEETIIRWLGMMPGERDPDVKCILAQLKPYITGYPIDRDRVLCTADCGGTTVAGWVPVEVKVGDQLCQFTGSPYPFLLRKLDDDSYRLLGDAFTAGISEPEALGLDHEVWSSHLDSIRQCDTALRAWMKSDDRKEKKVAKDDLRLNRTDERLKSARQDAINCLKGLYSKVDGDLGWIRLR